MRAGSPELAFRVRSPGSAPVSRESRCTVGRCALLRGVAGDCRPYMIRADAYSKKLVGIGMRLRVRQRHLYPLRYGATGMSLSLDKFRCSSNLMAMRSIGISTSSRVMNLGSLDAV